MTPTRTIAPLAALALLAPLAAAAPKVEKVKEFNLANAESVTATQGASVVRAEDFDATNSDERYEAVLEPQNFELTENAATARCVFYATNPGGTNDYNGDAQNYIDLQRGWIYVRVTDDTPVLAEEGAGPGTVDDRPKRYPVTTVRAIGAGAEGTDLLVAVTRQWDNDGTPTNNARVLVMHMGGGPMSKVWVSCPRGAPGGDYRTKHIFSAKRNRGCRAIIVENFFDSDDTNDVYGNIRWVRFRNDPEARAIFEDVSARRDADPATFFQAGRLAD
jgi:hypothetical protein